MKSFESVEISNLGVNDVIHVDSSKQGPSRKSRRLLWWTLAVLLALGCSTVVGLAVYVSTSGQRTNTCSPAEDSQNEMTINSSTVAKRSGDSNQFFPTVASTDADATPETLSPGIRDRRLPSSLVPIRYGIRLQPNFEPAHSWDFTGSVSIRILVKERTDVMTLHSLYLTYDNDSISVVRLSSGGRDAATEERIHIRFCSTDEEREFITIHLEKCLEPEETYVLRINYSGLLFEDFVGLFKTEYREGDETKWMVASHMEPTYARAVFPCFDEPAFKAKFDVTLIRPANMMSLSNMPLKSSQQRSDGLVEDEFEPTTNDMSTYLLAFVICEDFDFKSANSTNHVLFRTWSRRSAIQQVDYGLSMGIKIHNFYEDYFAAPYPLPKQDMLAVPTIGLSAMENWGLILYREVSLLYDPGRSAIVDKQVVALFVSHELAHQWFGNLVSPSWWDDVWLKEGFSTYLSYLGIDNAEPEWKMLDQFLIEDLHKVLILDGLSTSHPVYTPVSTQDEIYSAFDEITYSKGASLIRMLHKFIGACIFQRGLQRFLKKFEHGNVNHSDLWGVLTQESTLSGHPQLDISRIMDPWIKQVGYPLVNITQSPGTPHRWRVTQQKFQSDPSLPVPYNESIYGYIWNIPLTYLSGSEDDRWEDPHAMWLEGNESSLDLPTDSWIIGNIGQYGYYRVNYDQTNWNQLVQQLCDDHKKIPEKNRAQIIDDAFQIGKAGYISQVIGLETTKYISNETEYVPWKAAATNIAYIKDMLERSPLYGDLERYMVKQLEKIYNTLGWSDQRTDTNSIKLLRHLIILQACSYGHEHCVEQARHRFNQWMKNPTNNTPDADVRYTVYCTGVKHGGDKEWNFVYEQWKKSSIGSETINLLQAMACSRVPWIISRYTDIAWSHLEQQDSLLVLGHIARSGPIGRQMVWKYVVNNWVSIKSRLFDNPFALKRLFSCSTESFNSEGDLMEMEEFQRRHFHQEGSASSVFQTVIETVKTNIRWMERNVRPVAYWLKDWLEKI